MKGVVGMSLSVRQHAATIAVALFTAAVALLGLAVGVGLSGRNVRGMPAGI